MLVQCCVCKQVRVGEEWKTVEVKPVVVSSSYCPVCLENVRILFDLKLSAIA